MTLICIIPGPTVELARRDAGVRWCFGCRQHLPHADVFMADKGWDRGESYYDPTWSRQCSRCGQDRTHFPGTDLR